MLLGNTHIFFGRLGSHGRFTQKHDVVNIHDDQADAALTVDNFPTNEQTPVNGCAHELTVLHEVSRNVVVTDFPS